MPVSSDELRIAMRAWATGVTIVGAQHEGVLHGMTVSSFTSLSLEPPLVLVSLEIGTRTHKLLEKAVTFGVTIVSASQREVSNCFANPNAELGDRLAGRDVFYLKTGAPFVAGGLAHFDCQIINVFPAGTHSVLIAEVVATRIIGQEDSNMEPLLYFNRHYRELQDSGN